MRDDDMPSVGGQRYGGRSHTHPCYTDGCKHKVVCGGDWVRNHDGFPEVICDEYHERMDGMVFCEVCNERHEREQAAQAAEEAAAELSDPRRV